MFFIGNDPHKRGHAARIEVLGSLAVFKTPSRFIYDSVILNIVRYVLL